MLSRSRCGCVFLGTPDQNARRTAEGRRALLVRPCSHVRGVSIEWSARGTTFQELTDDETDEVMGELVDIFALVNKMVDKIERAR